jgi:branched-chain amino acid transport system permease protein
MELLITQLVNGVVYGMLLFLLASGLSLIFGLMNVVSLVHGSFFMLGAFVGLSLAQLTDSYWVALAISPLIGLGLGVVMERLFIRQLYDRGHLDQVLLTFGFTFVFVDLVKWVWSANIRSMAPPTFLAGMVHLLDGLIPSFRLFLLGLGLVIALLMWLLLERTRVGAMVRAGVDDSAMALGLGINVPRLFTAIFALGSGLAALAGVAAGPMLGVYPGMDIDFMIPAFIVIVIGGMGTLRGAFVGSLLVGVADTLGKAYFPSGAMFLIYLLMVAVLVLRPQGLFGVLKGVENSVMPAVAGSDALPQEQPLRRLLGSIVLALLLVLPLLRSSYLDNLVVEVMIFGILAMSLDLLLGYTGLVSFGHAAFFGVAAYAAIICGTTFGLGPWLALACGIISAAGVAAVVGMFCTTVRGVSFLMLTMAFGQLLYSLSVQWRGVTGGSDGIGGLARPKLLGWSLIDPASFYYLVLFGFLLAFLAMHRLIVSPLGQVFVGIRENEQRMLAIGYATRRYKVIAFTVAGAFAGLSGSLFALFNGFISPESLYWTASGDVLIMVVLGGVGTITGPVLGSAIFLLMKNVVSTHTDHWMLIIGAIFAACVMFFRRGAYGSLSLAKLPVRSGRWLF